MNYKLKLIPLLFSFICTNTFADDLIANHSILDNKTEKIRNIKSSIIQKLWQLKIDTIPEKIYIDQNNNIYVIGKNNTNKKLYLITADGKEKWHFDLSNQDYSSPCGIFQEMSMYLVMICLSPLFHLTAVYGGASICQMQKMKLVIRMSI